MPRFSLKRLLLWFVLIAIALTAYRRIGALGQIERRGGVIVQALARYHADYNQYPATLDELCPKYLDSIPSPTWGLRVWKYGRDSSYSRAGYYLGVDEDENVGNGDSYMFHYMGPPHGWQLAD